MNKTSDTENRYDFRWGMPVLDESKNGQFLYDFMLKTYSEVGASHEEFLLILHLMAFRYNVSGSESKPSLNTIAIEMGLTPQRVYQIVFSLENKGLLLVERHPGRPSNYTGLPLAEACLSVWTTRKEKYTSKENSTCKIYSESGKENVTTPLKKSIHETETIDKQSIAQSERATLTIPSPEKNPVVSLPGSGLSNAGGSVRKVALSADRERKRVEIAETKARLDALDANIAVALTTFQAGIANGHKPAPLTPQFLEKHCKAMSDLLAAGYTAKDVSNAAFWLKNKWVSFGGTVTPTNLAANIHEWSAAGRPSRPQQQAIEETVSDADLLASFERKR